MPDVVFNISLQPEMQISTNDFADGVELTDERLVQAVLEGDENAFGEIFDVRYKRHVTRTVSRFFRDPSDIEDFVQQSFTKAYFSLKNFRGGAEYSLTSWLTKIAVNVCYDEFRRRQRRGENLFTEITTEEKDFLETIADNRNGSAENAVVAFQLVEKLLSGLDPRVASKKVRGGLGWHIVLGIALSATYEIIMKFSITFSTNASLPAILGVWIPNLIFGGIAIFLLLKAPK